MLPRLVEPEALRSVLDADGLLIVDIGNETTYRQLHVPGAIHLAYDRIIASKPPVFGLLPGIVQLEEVMGSIGADRNTHIVVYDDEGGGNASRLLWTLKVMGHANCSLLNGGIHAWANEKNPITRDPGHITPTLYEAEWNTGCVALTDDILNLIDDPDTALWDARSINEYKGITRFSQYPGHIPGAVNLDWLELMDRNNNIRLKPLEQISQTLEKLGLGQDKSVITYCQTHHRSSLAWFVLDLLDYENCRGYPGSWSDWGNRDDTPKEQ